MYFSNKVSPACFANFTIHQPPRRSWSFIRPINTTIHVSSVFLTHTRTRSEFPSQVHSALCQCPSVCLDWLPVQYLAFGRRLSFLVSTGGLAIIPISLHYGYIVHAYIERPLGIYLEPSTNPSITADDFTANVLLVASPNVARIQSRADGFSMRHAVTPPPTQRAINAR